MSGDKKTDDVDKPEAINSPEAEVLDEEPRNLLLALMSEIRIGMDLSRITLPTFILEPRSMLDKLSDFMTHGELLALAGKQETPIDRLVAIVRWYLSGFYIKPQGVKKPYNPILGEIFRCKWNHEDGTTTHYVAEQVSHHPPISCLYISNRKAGFVINGCIQPKSKFLGTSAASIMEGEAVVTLLPHDEEYTITFPTVYGRGILFGTLLMELCGMVNIVCAASQCKAEIDFKPKPFFGGEYNVVNAKLKHKKDTLFTVTGKWDTKLEVTGSGRGKKPETLFDSTTAKRIPKTVRPMDEQEEFESQRLWVNVTNAIKKRDQKEATAEKTKLEDAQRQDVKARKEKLERWDARLFRKNSQDQWVYKYRNLDKYSPDEGDETEEDGIIFLKNVGKDATKAQYATPSSPRIRSDDDDRRLSPGTRPGSWRILSK